MPEGVLKLPERPWLVLNLTRSLCGLAAMPHRPVCSRTVLHDDCLAATEKHPVSYFFPFVELIVTVTMGLSTVPSLTTRLTT
jgi:hypothetical protein